jgi:hypothetical protein
MYWFKFRDDDGFPMETRFLRTWESAKKYAENLGCKCCTLAPPIETLVQGKLYEIGYSGSFRFMGCIAEGLKNWVMDEPSDPKD